jgi:hypothetical protein
MQTRTINAPDGFLWLPNGVTDLIPTIGPQALAVLVMLARFAGSKRVCWPSYATIGKICGCSRSTVVRALATLEEYKLIRVQGTMDKSGSRSANRYHLLDVPTKYQPVQPVLESDVRPVYIRPRKRVS